MPACWFQVLLLSTTEIVKTEAVKALESCEESPAASVQEGHYHIMLPLHSAHVGVCGLPFFIFFLSIIYFEGKVGLC